MVIGHILGKGHEFRLENRQNLLQTAQMKVHQILIHPVHQLGFIVKGV